MLRPPQRNHGNGDSERNTGLRGRDKWFNGMHAPTPATHALVDADLYGTLKEKHTRLSPTQLCAMYDDVRDRTLRALGSLEDIQMHGEIESSGGEVLTSNMTCACTPKFMNRLFFMTTLAPIVMTGMSGLDFIEARAKRRIKQMVLDKAGEYIFDPKNLKAKDKQTFMGNFERAGRKLKIFAAALTATANVERAFRGTVGDSMAVVGALYEQQA